MTTGYSGMNFDPTLYAFGFLIGFTVTSFIFAGLWLRNRGRAGILIGNSNSPLPFEAPPVACWAFGLSTLGELVASQFSGLEAMTEIFYFQVIIGLLFLAFFSGQKDPFGWLRLNPLKVLAIGFVGACAVFVGTTMITQVEEAVAGWMHYPLQEQTVVKQLQGMKNGQIIEILLMNAVILSPLVEELFFRGFVYTALKKWLKPAYAMVISGTVFGMIHWNIYGFIPLSCMGIALALVYETTGSLIASIAIHAGFNSISCGLILYQSFWSSPS